MGAVITQPKSRIKLGTYSGNGAATQAITGVGFQPNLVLVCPSHVNYDSWLKLETMGINAKAISETNYTNNVIISFDVNGFTVGNSGYINVTGVVYHYLAIRI
jgi:hypothetical protein